MSSLIIRTIISLSLLFSTIASHAADLTDQTVANWLKSYDAVQLWTNEHQSELDALQASVAPGIGNTNEVMQNSPVYADMVKLLRGYGFETPERWSQTGEQIMFAYAALVQTSVREDFTKEIEDIRNDPNMTTEQKEAMLNLLQHTQSMANRFSNVSEADQAAVAKYQDQITALAEKQ
ncbi:hypothetical protein [Echinimonas agarilytica]|uniref:LTXXQ motif family protein n=1 Tax=Echinimonas agarilytica TaxID=1215918 RepID=A0AA41W472_9GAMM|nr:hypothetical protein [Echinimonas agarilytica]MCM2678425.1 hypothetical protein [Echinimonas agarilytica]